MPFERSHSGVVCPPAVIAGLDAAIPIMWHGGALLSGMAGSSPAMTNPWEPERLARNRYWFSK
jgi:hypothetical protein